MPHPPPRPPVVRQSGLQPVRPLRGAPQIPPRPALLHPPPRLHVAALGPGSKQHSGEHPAQSHLIRLHGWVRTTCTHTEAGTGHRSPWADAFCTLITQFPFADNGRRGDTHSCSRVRIPTRRSEMMNFFYLRRAQWHYQHAARLRNALLIAGAGWWRAACRPQPVPQTLHHVSALDVDAFHQFQSVFFLLHSTRTKHLAMAGTIAHLGPDVPFFFLSHVWCVQRIFLLPSLDAQIFSVRPVAFEPRQASIFLSGRRPKRRLKAISVQRRLIYWENQSDDFIFQTLRPTWRYAIMEKHCHRCDGRRVLPFIWCLRVLGFPQPLSLIDQFRMNILDWICAAESTQGKSLRLGKGYIKVTQTVCKHPSMPWVSSCHLDTVFTYNLSLFSFVYANAFSYSCFFKTNIHIPDTSDVRRFLCSWAEQEVISLLLISWQG